MKVVPLRKFGDRLREALKEADKSQADLSRHFKITPQAINQWVGAKKPPELEIDRWLQLSQFLNINLEWLCWGVGRKGRVDMNDQAFELLRRFQLLDANQQEIVNTTIDTFIAQKGNPKVFPEGKRR